MTYEEKRLEVLTGMWWSGVHINAVIRYAGEKGSYRGAGLLALRIMRAIDDRRFMVYDPEKDHPYWDPQWRSLPREAKYRSMAEFAKVHSLELIALQ